MLYSSASAFSQINPPFVKFLVSLTVVKQLVIHTSADDRSEI